MIGYGFLSAAESNGALEFRGGPWNNGGVWVPLISLVTVLTLMLISSGPVLSWLLILLSFFSMRVNDSVFYKSGCRDVSSLILLSLSLTRLSLIFFRD